MRIAFLADPLDIFNIKKDSTFAMMREAATRGHTLFAFEQHDMRVSTGRVLAHARQIAMTGETKPLVCRRNQRPVWPGRIRRRGNAS